MRPSVLLAVLAVIFLGAFAFQREHSVFLRVERGSEQAREVAAATGLRLPEVMALHELRGGRLDLTQLTAFAKDFSRARRTLGHDALAILSVMWGRELAKGSLAKAGGDSESAWTIWRGRREAITSVRFLAMVKRFESRGHR